MNGITSSALFPNAISCAFWQRKEPLLSIESVGEHMTHPVVTCTEHHSIDWLMEEMTARRFRHMPVSEHGRLAGIVSIGDVVKFKIARAESEAQQMRQYFVAG